MFEPWDIVEITKIATWDSYEGQLILFFAFKPISSLIIEAIGVKVSYHDTWWNNKGIVWLLAHRM